MHSYLEAVIHLQFWAYGSWDSLFPISMSPNCKITSPKHYFNGKSVILLHPGTRQDSVKKNLCAKDAGCAGNKITVEACSYGKFLNLTLKVPIMSAADDKFLRQFS